MTEQEHECWLRINENDCDVENICPVNVCPAGNFLNKLRKTLWCITK